MLVFLGIKFPIVVGCPETYGLLGLESLGNLDQYRCRTVLVFLVAQLFSLPELVAWLWSLTEVLVALL